MILLFEPCTSVLYKLFQFILLPFYVFRMRLTKITRNPVRRLSYSGGVATSFVYMWVGWFFVRQCRVQFLRYNKIISISFGICCNLQLLFCRPRMYSRNSALQLTMHCGAYVHASYYYYLCQVLSCYNVRKRANVFMVKTIKRHSVMLRHLYGKIERIFFFDTIITHCPLFSRRYAIQLNTGGEWVGDYFSCFTTPIFLRITTTDKVFYISRSVRQIPRQYIYRRTVRFPKPAVSAFGWSFFFFCFPNRNHGVIEILR